MAYATQSAENPRKVGIVEQREIRQVVFDVNFSTSDYSNDGSNTEYIIRVNGRVIRRLSRFQAERMGIISGMRG